MHSFVCAKIMEEEIYNEELCNKEEICNEEELHNEGNNKEEIHNEEEMYEAEICNDLVTMKDEEYNIGDIRNKHQEKIEMRKVFHKTPIKKYDYQLEYDYESSQDKRRRLLLERQKQ